MSDVILTARATAEGGREGHVRSDDGRVDLDLAMPTEGKSGDGSNPEQLFASGYAACFDGALNLVATKQGKDIESSITAEVSLLKDPEDNGFKIGVDLNVDIKGVSEADAKDLVEKAHQVCPYSKATRGNIDVTLNV